MHRIIPIVAIVLCLWGCQKTKEPYQGGPIAVSEKLFVDSIWTGHPVGFALLTKPPHQFVAYYDKHQQMIVAQRQLGDDHWQYQPLPETIGWDSHNAIRMELDEQGYLHLSGNMHVDTLNYYRTTQPYDISTFEQVRQMVGEDEDRVTYPEFFHNSQGQLVFTYRDGSSGKGNQIYNVYDADSKTWKRLLDTQLVDGQGEMNAYLHGPTLGPDGYYHLIWVWRDTPDAATNHDLSYAKSKDLITWYQSDGSPQSLPITFQNAEVIDPVPAKGGIINGNIRIGFDQQHHPVVTYHKYDADGNTQIYNARLEQDGWQSYQATHWDFRWDFGGNGSITAEVGVSPVRVNAVGQLTQKFYSARLGKSQYVLNDTSLAQQEELALFPVFPATLDSLQTNFPDMRTHFLYDEESTMKDSWYVLRWETLTRNRDQPRTGALPGPVPLVLYQITKN
ncbi:MAG: BNR repeat-containing protein [Cyclobacteriaceae bacterium]